MAHETTEPCPDPSVHHKQNKLSEQASTAALYVTHPERGTNPRENIIGSDGKLSSRSAAASLKYARAQDLPSFPSVGINTANSAGQAAMLAKDYKMKELWQPELSSAGSRAALLAHKDGGKLNLWQPTASADGNSAAKLAMRNKTLSPQIDHGYTKDGRSNALLAATKSQRDGRRRAGSTPAPALPLYPDSANSAHNALNAATISHRASVKSPAKQDPLQPDGWDSAAMQAARIQHIGDNIDREMFTEKPPVEIEQQELRDKAALRASAVSMAKQMYEYQNRTVLGDASDASSVRGGHLRNASSTSQPDIKQEAMKYIHLQDAAHKLAAERLAKVDKNMEHARYREYYGYSMNQPRSRLSMRGRGRRRASSEAGADELDSDDEERARRVRSQMLQFNTALATVDQKKQQTDRENLLAAAQKRVQKSMQDMDEKVFQETGKVSQAMMDEWETKAKKRAAEDAEKREANRGKTHIGGGKYMDTTEIEAIAQARLKPTLDEIDDNAEKKRARDEELRLDKEEQKRIEREEKQKHKEEKDEQKRIKSEEKAHVKEEKAAAKKEKEERKAAEKEEKEERKAAEKEEKVRTTDEKEHRKSFLSRFSTKRKSREVSKQQAGETPAAAAAGATLGEVADHVRDDSDDDDLIATTDDEAAQPEIAAAASKDVAPVATAAKHDTSDAVASSSSPKDEPTVESPSKLAAEDDDDKPQKGVRGFFSKLRNNRKSVIEDKDATSSSPTEAVLGSAPEADHQNFKGEDAAEPVVAGTVTEPPELPQHVGTDGTIGDSKHVSGLNGNPTAVSPSSFKRHDAGDDADVSSLSSSGLEEDHLREGRTGRMARALGLGGKRKGKGKDKTEEKESEAKDEKEADDGGDETFEEARDFVDPGLAPEPSFAAQKKSISPVRETRFQEQL